MWDQAQCYRWASTGFSGCWRLAIGSFDRNRFTLGTDTDFLARMAEIISAALGKHLKK
jgi:uncharacterized protein YigA (DUF484 family)